MLYVAGSISTNTGVAPSRVIELTVAKKLYGVVMTSSPLMLHYTDEVALQVDGEVVARGSHADLLAGDARYRQVVARGMEEDE